MRKNYLLKKMSFGLKAEKSYHGLYSKKIKLEKCLKKKKKFGMSSHSCVIFLSKETIFCVYFSMQISGIVELLWKLNLIVGKTTTEMLFDRVKSIRFYLFFFFSQIGRTNLP